MTDFKIEGNETGTKDETMERKSAPTLKAPIDVFTDRRAARVELVKKNLGSKAKGKMFVYKGRNEDVDYLSDIGYKVAQMKDGEPVGDKGDVLYMIDEELYNSRHIETSRRSREALKMTMAGKGQNSETLSPMG